MKVLVCEPGDANCGIQHYSDSLCLELAGKVSLQRLAIPRPVGRWNRKQLLKESAKCDAVLLHHEYSFFGIGSILSQWMSYRRFISAMRVPVIAIVHTVLNTQAFSKKSFESSPAKFGQTVLWNLGFRHLLRMLYTRWMFSGISCLIFHTEETRANMDRSILKQARHIVLPHFVFPCGHMDASQNMVALLSKKYELNPSMPMILSPGFITPGKKQTILIDALGKCPEETMLVFAGGPKSDEDKRYLSQLIEYSTKLKAPCKIVVTGYLPLDQLYALMRASVAVVIPYDGQSGSGMLNRALGCGAVVIACDSPSFRRVEKEYECILLFESDNSDSLAKEISGLVANRATTLQSLKGGMDQYLQRNSIEAFASNVTHALSQFLRD